MMRFWGEGNKQNENFLTFQLFKINSIVTGNWLKSTKPTNNNGKNKKNYRPTAKNPSEVNSEILETLNKP